ncbi:MAG: (S)-2-hydroxy-acid oxidase [Peptococcaceae bacterium BICA1-8]|nr:MAG: (S)-2-hydroxy-acid oxidase [Peptococcaceae bacterium BICA1-8]
MNGEEVLLKAKMKGVCRNCRNCDGRVCAGEVPGMGGIGTGSSFRANVEALAKIKINMSVVHGVHSPHTEVEFMNLSLKTPILVAPIGGMDVNLGGVLSEAEYNHAVVVGANKAGSIAMTGDGPNLLHFKSGLNAIASVGTGIPVIKPRFSEEILERFKLAAESGATAVGIDIDAAGLVNMTKSNQLVGPKTEMELSEIISKSPLPVIIKGIMTPEDALKVLNAGAAGIVVSNHGGRVLDFTPGTAEVLPAIARQVKGKLTILVDGGIRSGIDVLKMLALGADAVLIGRPVTRAAIEGGGDAVRELLEKLSDELRTAMILTGCEKIEDIGSQVIYQG